MQKFGKYIAAARDTSGMSVRQLAKAINVSPGTITNWELGRHTPHIDDIRRLGEVLGTNGYLEEIFKDFVSVKLPNEWSDKWEAAEHEANMIFVYQHTIVDGLLQTEDYARRVIEYNQHAPFDVEQRVQRRMKRQEILNGDDRPSCTFVLDEYVLHRNVGGPDVMVPELEHLRDMAKLPKITVKIIPYGKEHIATIPFMIARMDGVEIATIDDALTGRIIETYGDVTQIMMMWDDVREAALPAEESLEMIERAIEEWQQKM